MFKLRGRRPGILGVEGGRFRAPRSWKPNWVSSQADTSDAHYIAPLAVKGDARQALARLKAVVAGMPGAEIITTGNDYLYAEFSTPLMGFVDDVEFVADGSAIHVRSSSRLGIRDFNVNRKRVEAIRAALGE